MAGRLKSPMFFTIKRRTLIIHQIRPRKPDLAVWVANLNSDGDGNPGYDRKKEGLSG
jgi:hypothetical protein